jgi:hypothetical protein
MKPMNTTITQEQYLTQNTTPETIWFLNTFTPYGFLCAPLATYKNKTLTAKSIKIYDLNELYILMNNFNYYEEKFFLYKFEFHNSIIQYETLDQQTFEHKKLDIPTITEPYHLLRYATTP